MNKERLYNKWAGNPKGVKEDKTLCIEEIFRGFVPHQCNRKRGYGEKGLFCKQHAKINKRHRLRKEGRVEKNIIEQSKNAKRLTRIAGKIREALKDEPNISVLIVHDSIKIKPRD